MLNAAPPEMTQDPRERQLQLARRERSPVALLAELARRCTSAEPGADVLELALGSLARDLDLEDVSLASAASAHPLTTPDAGDGSLRVPVAWKRRTLGYLTARTKPSALASPALAHTLALASELIAPYVHERVDQLACPPRMATDGALPLVLLGESTAARALRAAVERVAASAATVLLSGEHGSGKEAVARAIAERSTHPERSFTVVQCGAHQESLPRAIFEAVGGTLFFDDVSALGRTAQADLAHLVRSLQDPAEDSPRVRVLAGTSVPLAYAVREGRFRDDLYYQLEEFPIEVPSLRERRTDIALLATRTLEAQVARHGRSSARISDSALELLVAYDWPGNLRELASCMARALLLAHYGVVRQHHLPAALQPASVSVAAPVSLDEQLCAFEHALIREALERAHGSHVEAARALGVTPRVLSYRLKRTRDTSAARRDEERV